MADGKKDRVGIATVCIHISAVLYLMVGVVFLGVSQAPDLREDLPAGFAVVLVVVCLACAAVLEIVAAGLRRRRFWAWVAGLCIFGLYLPSLFLPLGALGLWGLLAPGSRAAFGIGVQSKTA